MSPIDWTALARDLGTLRENGEAGSADLARQAIAEILGADVLRDAIEHYLAHRPGAELARSVLWLLRAPAAMEMCHDVFLHDPDLDRRRTAIELVRVFADGRALPWVAECFDEADPDIQSWGASMLDQLLFRKVIELEAAEPYLQIGEAHANEHVRETMGAIRRWLAEPTSPSSSRVKA